MKRFIVVGLILLFGIRAEAQQSLSFGVSQISLDAVAGGAGTVGTAYAAPAGGDAALVTWTTLYSAPPASVTMTLQASLDNTTWYTLDTSTAVGGELRNIATSARFFRCNISAVSGAVNKTCSFVLKRSNAAVSSSGSVFAGNVSSGGQFLASAGSATAPSYSFTGRTGDGFYSVVNGSIGTSILGVLRTTTSTNGHQVYIGQYLAPDGTALLPSYSYTASPTLGFWRDPTIGTTHQGHLTLANTVRLSDGTSGAPSYTFTSEPTLGFWRSGAGIVTTQGNHAITGNLGVTGSATVGVSGFVSGGGISLASSGNLVWSTRGVLSSPSDGNIILRNNGATTGSQIKVDALPTIASGFGTAPSIVAGSTPFAGAVDVGTGGVATTGVINFNGTAFPSMPFCIVSQGGQSGGAVTPSTATATALTIGPGAAFNAGAIIRWICVSSK